MAWWRLDVGPWRARRKPEPEAPEAATVLGEACTFRAPARVIDPASGERLEARFVSLVGDRLVLDLAGGPERTALRPLAMCLVLFAWRSRNLTFLSVVQQLDAAATPERPRQLALRCPSELAGDDLRSAPRLPTPAGCGLEATLVTADGHRWTAQPVNLSASGVMLELPEPTLATLDRHASDELLTVELRLGELCSRLPAAARRREDGRMALSFLGAVRDGQLDTPGSLRSILEQVRRPGAPAPGRPPVDAPPSR